MKEIRPALMASLPSVGPITVSDTILAGAGSFPDLRIFARSSASSIVKSPVISVLPPVISTSTLGYERTYPSRTTAIHLPMFSRVILAHVLAPSAFIEKSTLTSDPVTPEEGRAEVITSPSMGGRPSRVVTFIA